MLSFEMDRRYNYFQTLFCMYIFPERKKWPSKAERVLVEVKLAGLSVGQSRLVVLSCRSVIIFLMDRKFHFHAPIGALV